MIRTEMKKKPTCPSCAATDLVPIVYGYPDSELFEAADRGEVAIGGCVVYGNDPKWLCRVCGTRILADGTAAVSEAV
jgi:hypothetical protein